MQVSREVVIITLNWMYRVSNHWGRLANSKWRLEPMQTESGSKLK
jgi:hypothetical protein